MCREIQLIYVGILKYGFKSRGDISVIGLLNFIEKHNLFLKEMPYVSVNREYILRGDDYFWELEWWNSESPFEYRCLLVFFDKNGCHYQRIVDFYNKDVKDFDGDITNYSDFLNHFRWLEGKID